MCGRTYRRTAHEVFNFDCRDRYLLLRVVKSDDSRLRCTATRLVKTVNIKRSAWNELDENVYDLI